MAALRKKVDDRFTMDYIVHESFLCEEIIHLTSLVFDGDEKSRKDGGWGKERGILTRL